MDLFAEIVQRCSSSTIFCEKFRLRCPTEFEYHSADSKTLLTFSKSQVADLFVNLTPIGTFSKQMWNLTVLPTNQHFVLQ